MSDSINLYNAMGAYGHKAFSGAGTVTPDAGRPLFGAIKAVNGDVVISALTSTDSVAPILSLSIRETDTLLLTNISSFTVTGGQGIAYYQTPR